MEMEWSRMEWNSKAWSHVELENHGVRVTLEK